RDLARAPGRGVVDPQRGGALVHDARAVGLRVARVVRIVVGVTPDVAAVGAARIEIADALAVGEVVDALAEPHRAGDVAGQRGEAREATAASTSATLFGVVPVR